MDDQDLREGCWLNCYLPVFSCLVYLGINTPALIDHKVIKTDKSIKFESFMFKKLQFSVPSPARPSVGAASWAVPGFLQQYNFNVPWQNDPEFPFSLKQTDPVINTSRWIFRISEGTAGWATPTFFPLACSVLIVEQGPHKKISSEDCKRSKNT